MAEDVFLMYLEEVKELESCDEAENSLLLGRLKSGDRTVRDRLVEGNLKAVLEMVQEYLNKGVPAGDLVQEANMALMMAVEEYEEGQFESYLRDRVKEALLAALEEQSREEKTARKMVDRVNALKDISSEMARELGREATVEELARRMKLTGDEIKEIMKVTLDAMTVVGAEGGAGME